ncbi:MAG: flavin reductase [Prevotellaceae bacterium]|jgi:flavin reductase (DIM6/NTAB) family NADH-FMN oxidoreductase RutF|nr:flavin reductase [Prevotellaceae bacterium]
MKKTLLIFIGAIGIAACNQPASSGSAAGTESPFEGFVSIAPGEIGENPFTRIDAAYLITAGDGDDYNTMTAGWGSWGIFFSEPTATCLLRANRYTLEYIRRTRSYTLAFFDDVWREEVLYFGQSSGRTGDKMKAHPLTAVVTPAGNVAYREASLIMECELVQLSTVHPDDFFRDSDRAFIDGGYEEAKDYHKWVVGRITNVWVKAD